MIDNQPQKDALDTIQRGRLMLLEDMKKYPSFDPKQNYHRKNEYAQRANDEGYPLMVSDTFFIAEVYFSLMLETTLDYEKSNGKNFNKGYFYANLGICQIVNGKVGAGIDSLLSAEIEDKPVNSPNYDILNEILWSQFEINYIYPFIYHFVANPSADLKFPVNEQFLNELFRKMDRQTRIFCQIVLLDLRTSKEQHTRQPNEYTLGRLYSGLKDLCLVTETLLRKKQILLGKFKPTDAPTLSVLLEKTILSKLGISFDKHKNYNGASNLNEFLNNLEFFLVLTDSLERRTFITRLVRNFTGHHFEVSDTVSSSSGKTFFKDFYDLVLANVLAILFFLKHENEI